MTTRPPKKTDKLEVRLPTETKDAFVDRCRSERRTASEAVRALIEAHLAPQEVAMGARRMTRSPLAYAGLAAAIGGVLIAMQAKPSQAEPDFAAIFQSLDGDGDGQVSPREFNRTTGRAPPPPATGKTSASARLSAGFQETDANKDGGVSLAEFVAINRTAIERRFLALDGDSDGLLTLAELQRDGAPLSEAGTGLAIRGAADRYFARFDADRDGSISRTEFFKLP